MIHGPDTQMNRVTGDDYNQEGHSFLGFKGSFGDEVTCRVILNVIETDPDSSQVRTRTVNQGTGGMYTVMGKTSSPLDRVPLRCANSSMKNRWFLADVETLFH